jgi:hypothetical protein
MPERSIPRALIVLYLLVQAILLDVRAQDTKWKFMVFADSQAGDWTPGLNTNVFQETIRAILREQPAFVMFGGDFANIPTLEHYEEWTNLMWPVYEAGIKVYPVMGNHDTPDAVSFHTVLDRFIPDNGPADELKRSYFFIHENALVLMLDTCNLDPAKLLRVNQPWIDAVLATNDQPHVFAMGHVPAFSAYHIDCLGTYPADRDAFWRSLSNAQCRIYFSGHDHFYDHSRLEDGDGDPDNDTHQIIVGTGGGFLYVDTPYDGTNGIWTPVRAFHEQIHGYVTVDVEGSRVSTHWHRRIAPDVFELTTEGFSYVAPPPVPRLRFSYSGTNLVLRWTGVRVLEESPGPYGPYSELPNASSPYRVNVSGDQTRYFRLAALEPETP